MKNISDIRNCYGCGVCASICGKKIIDMKMNEDGFYQPFIHDIKACTSCGLCLEVCAFTHTKLAQENDTVASFAGWSKDNAVRRKCSSGGVAFEVCKRMLNNGYKICGVRYNAENERAEHFIAESEAELVQTVGSKYLQSYTLDAFKRINRKERYVVIGTPCQIDSFRRYLEKFKCEENFILIDFFCHGVPSSYLWKKYIQWAESQVGPISTVSWRNKWSGWHDSYNMLIKTKKKQLKSHWSNGDMFYNLFLGDCCLGNQCYERCKYKATESSADIRLGDLWGETFQKDDNGVSAIICFTKKGQDTLEESDCFLQEQPLGVVLEGQMKSNAKKTIAYNVVMNSLKNSDVTLVETDRKFKRVSWLIRNLARFKHPMEAFKLILTKIWK